MALIVDLTFHRGAAEIRSERRFLECIQAPAA